jgi:ankyrin repeat protein
MSKTTLVEQHPEFIEACKTGNVAALQPFFESARRRKLGAGATFEGLMLACRLGQVDVVRTLVDDWGVRQLNEPIKTAACHGHLAVVALLLEKHPSEAHRALGTAAEYGHLPIVQLMVSKGFKNIGWALTRANAFNHENVVEYLIDAGAKTAAEGLEDAAKKGNLSMVKLFVRKGMKNLSGALIRACGAGRMEVAEYLYSQGAKNLNKCLLAACENKQPEMAEFVIAKGANNFGSAFTAVCGSGCKRTLEVLISAVFGRFTGAKRVKVSVDLNEALRVASNMRYFDMGRRLIEHGASDVQAGMAVACGTGDVALLKSLLEKEEVQHMPRLMQIASEWKNTDIVHALMDNGAHFVTFPHALRAGCKHNDKVLVDRILNGGFTSVTVNDVLSEASRFGNLELIQYFLDKHATDLSGAFKTAVQYSKPKAAALLLQVAPDKDLFFRMQPCYIDPVVLHATTSVMRKEKLMSEEHQQLVDSVMRRALQYDRVNKINLFGMPEVDKLHLHVMIEPFGCRALLYANDLIRKELRGDILCRVHVDFLCQIIMTIKRIPVIPMDVKKKHVMSFLF